MTTSNVPKVMKDFGVVSIYKTVREVLTGDGWTVYETKYFECEEEYNTSFKQSVAFWARTTKKPRNLQLNGRVRVTGFCLGTYWIKDKEWLNYD